MKECFAIINQKGGVGKSTTSHALGAGLRQKGLRVLSVDLDAQGNLSYSMGVKERRCTAMELLTGDACAEDAILHTVQGDIIPASPALAGADTRITATGKEYRLREALATVADAYDYILLDTPPSLGILTVNALTACHGVIIPTQADIFSLQGIGQLYQTVQAVKKYCNPQIYVAGILLTRYRARAVLTRDMTALLEETAVQLQTKLYQTRIRECIAIKEAQAKRTDIFSYSAKSNASEDYWNFIEEVLHDGEENV